MTTRRLFLGAVTASLAACAAGAGAQDGRFVILPDVTTKTAIRPPRVTVWLPPGYDTDKRRYGVLYMHDGQNLFATGRSGNSWQADRAVERLVAARRIAPVVIVAVDHPGIDRFRQYMPAEPLAGRPALRADIEKQMGGTLLSDDYLRFLARELKPRIDREFRTRPDRNDTAIAGSSMGGLISFYALAMYPKTFGRAACLSSHWPAVFPSDAAVPPLRDAVIAMWRDWIAARLGSPDGRRVWFDQGDRTLDRWYAPYQAVVDDGLQRLGWREGRDFENRTYPGTAHEEAAWAARLPNVLAWLLR